MTKKSSNKGFNKHNYKINSSSRAGHNEVKNQLVDLFKVYGISGCMDSHQETAMEKLIFWTSRLILKLDSYKEKMKRTNGFDPQKILGGIIDDNSERKMFNKLNNQMIPMLDF